MIGATSKNASRDQALAVALMIGAVIVAMVISMDWWTAGRVVSLAVAFIMVFLAGALIGRVRGREIERCEQLKHDAP